MNAETYQDYRTQAMKNGAEFQDYICEQLHLRGIVLNMTTSREYQYKRENMLGLEIKYDMKFRETGRLYIETAEKAQPREGDYVPSGIYRTDDSWLYGIGDKYTFYIFAKNQLRRIDKANCAWVYRPEPTPTSQGFCVPIEQADILAALVVNFTGSEELGWKT